MRLLILAATFLVLGCAEPPLTREEQLFARPLIVGASVSDDTGTASPGKRLGLRYSRTYDIDVIAQGGAPGRNVIHAVSDSALAGRSIVLGLDFLFWDSAIPGSIAPSVGALQSLIDRTAALNAPLILGDIPALRLEAQVNREALNRQIHERCQRVKGCFILELDALHRELTEKGTLATKFGPMTLPEFLPDGLHLSRNGSEELADRVLTLLYGK